MHELLVYYIIDYNNQLCILESHTKYNYVSVISCTGCPFL